MAKKTLLNTLVVKKNEREIDLNSKYSKGSWGLIAKEKSEAVSGWNINRRILIRYRG